jgi:hypothetical protein
MFGRSRSDVVVVLHCGRRLWSPAILNHTPASIVGEALRWIVLATHRAMVFLTEAADDVPSNILKVNSQRSCSLGLRGIMCQCIQRFSVYFGRSWWLRSRGWILVARICASIEPVLNAWDGRFNSDTALPFYLSFYRSSTSQNTAIDIHCPKSLLCLCWARRARSEECFPEILGENSRAF